MGVVYFDQLLGAGGTTFFSRFQPFLFILKLLSDFKAEINKKCLKMNKIKRVFVYSLKLVDMQKLVDSLRGYLEKVSFFC